MAHNIGGSILPSSGHDTFDLVTVANGVLQVEANPALDTYFLMCDGRPFAEHPNGHSLRNLSKRMASGDADHALRQREYILACGGMAKSETAFRYLMGATAD